MSDALGALFPRMREAADRRRRHRQAMQDARWHNQEQRVEDRGDRHHARSQAKERRIERPMERKDARSAGRVERVQARTERAVARIDSRGRTPADDGGAWDTTAPEDTAPVDAAAPADAAEPMDMPMDEAPADGADPMDAAEAELSGRRRGRHGRHRHHKRHRPPPLPEPVEEDEEESIETTTVSGVRIHRGPMHERAVEHGNVRVTPRRGHAVALTPLAEGLYLMGEVPEALANEIGIIPLILPWMVKEAKNILDKHPPVVPDGQARPVRLIQEAKPGETVPAVAGDLPRRDTWGRPIRELPSPKWLTAQTADDFGCDCHKRRS